MADAELIFDLLTFLGPIPPRGGEAGAGAVNALTGLLARQRVHGAVAVPTRAVYADALAGNQEGQALVATAGESPVLVPGAVLDPRVFAGTAPQVGNARLLYLLPRTQNWTLPYAPVGALLKSLPTRTPILVEVRRPGEATAISAHLKEIGFAGTPVLLSGVTGNTLTEALAVAKAHDFVGLTTQGLRGIGEVRHAVSLLGAQRVFFASGAPAESLAAAVALVKLAGLPPEERAAVLGGNARRMLGVATPA